MTTPIPRTLPATLLLALLPCAGCGRPATVATQKSTEQSQSATDPLEDAAALLRRADAPAGCLEALRMVDRSLDQDPEGQDKVRKGTARLRTLQDRLGLTAAEFEEATAPGFRPLDAHHVYLCLLLRDAAEALHLHGLPPLEQARSAFAWVVRQVALRAEREDALFPPQIVLQLGEGSAHERALVFLALLQQLDLDGCMIALPGRDGGAERYWIPGVLLPDGDKSAIYLFDTRLGVPIPGPGGHGVATLRQVQKDPKLLAALAPDSDHPYDVTAEQVGGAVPHLVLPLPTLAPRMKYLEERLAKHDQVRLALEPESLLQRLAAAADGKVGVWNRRPQTGAPPWTPTRALRLFLPPEEGGTDRSRHWVQEQRAQLLWSALVVHHYRQMKAFDDLPPEARDRLRTLADSLFLKYIMLPHARLTRGLPEEATKALVHIESVVQEFRSAPITQAALAEEVVAWREQIKRAYLGVARKEPAAKKRVNALWAEDQYLLYLIDPSDGTDAPPRLEKHVLSFLVLKAAGGPLGDDALFLLGLAWQERAARQQAAGDVSAWTNAEGLAREYAQRYSLTATAVRERVQAVVAHWRWGEYNLEISLALWDALFRDLRRAATARLFQAHALTQTGKKAEARVVLRQLANEVAALRQEGGLNAALADCLKRIQQLPAEEQGLGGTRLQGLVRELEPGGGLYWLGQSARYQGGRPAHGLAKDR